jgi:hypothetical protein
MSAEGFLNLRLFGRNTTDKERAAKLACVFERRLSRKMAAMEPAYVF